MVINIANIVNKMISKSNENLENYKKGKLVIEDNDIGNSYNYILYVVLINYHHISRLMSCSFDDCIGRENEQNSEVDELGEHSASKDNNNIKAPPFQELQIDLEAVQKIMEREDTWIFAREIAHCLSMTTPHINSNQIDRDSTS